MLEYIRANTQSFGVKIAFAVIILVFVFWGIGSLNEGDSSRVVATVNGEPILIQQFERAYMDMEARLISQNPTLTREQLKTAHLGRQVLQGLVQETILNQEATRIGLTVTPQELRKVIGEIKSFQNEQGKFDSEIYTRVLKAQRIHPADYEQNIRLNVLREKLLELISTPAYFDPQEIRNRYNFLLEKRTVEYIFLPSTDFIDKVSVEDTTLQKYYDEHQKDFVLPAKIDVQYIRVTPDKTENGERLAEVVDNLIEDNILGKKLEESATRYGLQVQQSGLIDQAGLMEQLKLSPEDATRLLNAGNVPIDTALVSGDDYLIVRITQTEESSSQKFADVKPAILKTVRTQDALQLALDEAGQLLKEKKNLRQTKVAEPITRSETLAPFQLNTALNKAIFEANPDSWLAQAFSVTTQEGQTGALLCRLINIQVPEDQEWEKMQTIMESVVKRASTDALLSVFMQELMQRAKVRVLNAEFID